MGVFSWSTDPPRPPESSAVVAPDEKPKKVQAPQMALLSISCPHFGYSHHFMTDSCQFSPDKRFDNTFIRRGAQKLHKKLSSSVFQSSQVCIEAKTTRIRSYYCLNVEITFQQLSFGTLAIYTVSDVAMDTQVHAHQQQHGDGAWHVAGPLYFCQGAARTQNWAHQWHTFHA